MQGGVKLEVALFGAFRKFDNGAPFVLSVPSGSGLAEVRQALRDELTRRHPEFNQQTLIDESAFADEKSVLQNGCVFTQGTKLAILPPVCGG